MNPGYLTLIVLIVFVILLASGWKEYFFNGYSYKTMMIFVGGWLICSFLKLEIYLFHKLIILNVSFVFLLGFSVFLTIGFKSWVDRLNVITISLVLSFLDITLREASGLAFDYTAMLIALAVVTMQKRPAKQLACLLFAFLCSNIFSLFIHQRTQSFFLAEQSYQDVWWLTLLLSRIMTVMYQQSIAGFRKLYEGRFNKP